MQGPPQEVLEAFDDFGTVAMLAAGRLRTEVEDPAGIDVGLQLGENPGALGLGQARGIHHVEGQLNLRGGSIDVLPPWTATATELEM
jgi:hypothetical protein